MATSAIAVASWLEAGACRVSSATASFVGAPTAALLARTPRQNSDPLLSPCSRVCLRFALPASDELTIMSSVFCGSSHRWAFGGGVRRRTSRLAGRRKGHEFSLEDEKEHGRRGTGEEEFYWRWISASERRSTEADDDVWSKHSVFEFRSLNDPDTNASFYQGFDGQPGGVPGGRVRRPAAEPRPTAPPTPSAEPRRIAFDDKQQDVPRDAKADPNAWFRFREPEGIAPSEKKEGRVVDCGPSSAVKVELATQLGLPATATYDELRSAYRLEIKRCHPDMAGDNDFRVKFLQKRFQRLQSCWEEFAEEEQNATSRHAQSRSAKRSSRRSVSTGPTMEDGRAQAAQSAWAQAKAEAQAQRGARVAPSSTQRGRRVMDPGRNILDPGGPSC